MPSCDRCHRRFSSFAALKQHYANKHSNVRWPSEHEAKLVAEQEAEVAHKTRMLSRRPSRSKVIAAFLLILIAVGIAWYVVSSSWSGSTSSSALGDPTLTTCVTDATPLAEHIHAHLSIIINGQPVTIPANTGITPTCTRPVHTHDESGTIHVESPVVYPYTLHDFFLVWDQPFDNTQILQYKVDTTHTIRMTVNGAPNTKFENYVMHEGDQITITYGAAS